ncbi:hypothetical protein Pst134EB_027510 [Puccinia striiformis f. sp. tritici]|nr:hypothetical protein Pst134EB_027510 [Puccinia striiformis f. sp. tritici]
MSQVKESLSIEETNKIRISIGLKPLPTPDSNNNAPAELDPDQQAEQNYSKRRELAADQQEGEEEDLKKWVKRHKKNKHKIDPLLAAKKKEAELNADEIGKEYGSRDLEGIKVGHDLDDLQSNMMEEEKMVLTLKDSKILDGEDDELENVELAGHTRTKEAVELKKQSRQWVNILVTMMTSS